MSKLKVENGNLVLDGTVIATNISVDAATLTKIIVNEVFVSQDLGRLPMLLLAIVLCGVGRAIFGYIKEFTFDRTGSTIGTEMRRDIFSHVQSLSMDYFDQTKEWLDIYFSGRDPGFFPRIHLVGSDFRNRVGEIMCEIPYGKTVTYGWIADKLAGIIYNLLTSHTRSVRGRT